VKWANGDAADQIAKDRFFPGIEKRTLFSQGYISRRSSHSTGLAVDIAIEGLNFVDLEASPELNLYYDFIALQDAVGLLSTVFY
jgi:hypothetical protein